VIGRVSLALAVATTAAFGIVTGGSARADEPPCQTIGYQINVPEINPNWTQANGVPSVDVMAVRDAVAVFEMHVGFTYRYDGMTSWVASYGNVAAQPDDLEISVVVDDQDFNTPRLEHAAAFEWSVNGKSAIMMRWASVLNSGIDGTNAWQGGNSLFTTTEHELGHTLGLMHSALPTDIMYGGGLNTSTPMFYSVNDQRNLAAVSCHPYGVVTDTAP